MPGDRSRALGVAAHPTTEWIADQLTESRLLGVTPDVNVVPFLGMQPNDRWGALVLLGSQSYTALTGVN